MDADRLSAWIGRSEAADDVASAAPLALWRATLDQAGSLPAAGEPLPPLAHWLYFLPRHRQSELGPDGHAKRGGFLPPVPLPRRMWAGSRVEFVQPIRIGERLHRVSKILDVSEKTGRHGPLAFVRVEHRIDGPHGLALVEEHDIVYRGLPAAGAKAYAADAADAAGPSGPDPEPEAADWHEEKTADAVLLFRYSALTFNGHRIHYDREYVTGVEGYPGLIIHGPLLATLLADLATRRNGGRPLRRFEFRAERPLFDIHPFSLNGRADGDHAARLWAASADGRRAISARAEW